LGEKIQGARAREVSKISVILAGEASLERVNERAGYAYQPEHYPGQITVFEPKRNYDFHSKPRLGWDGFADALHAIQMPVYAGGLFEEHCVKLPAEKLRDCIDKAKHASEVELQAAG